jgi:nucleotide-binding universal stress UspA family protein
MRVKITQSAENMFDRILVPTDFSDHAKKTLICLTKIPGIRVVVLLHVIDATHYTRSGWTHEPEIENARILLNEEKQFLEGLGIEVNTRLEVITAGDIASSIVDVAKKERVSTIVMGSRGRGLIKGLLLGSASSGVLRHSLAHQLILRDSMVNVLTGEMLTKFCMGLPSRVLCPTDFSPPAQVAIDSLTKLEGLGETFLLHVVTKGESKAEIDKEVSDATERLTKIQKDLADKGIHAHIRIRLGRPTDEILRLAEEEDISLILMSSRGMGWIYNLLIGSTTHGVAIHSRRPVMVVRPSLPNE